MKAGCCNNCYWVIIFLCHFISHSSLACAFKGITFSQGYDKSDPPNSDGEPVRVYFNIIVKTVAPIQSAEMEFRVNFRMTMSWRDNRIKGNWTEWEVEANDNQVDCPPYLIIPPEVAKKIWLPDPFIVNSKYSAIKKFDSKLANMFILENELLSYTMILNATVSCAMEFYFYPMDIQTCPMVIQSFAYDNSILEFKWDTNEPFKVTPMRLIQFMVVPPPVPPAERLIQNSQGNWSQLVCTFRFQRLIGSHLVQSFIPCSLVVILSWFSFWLELDVTSTRGYLLMTSILTLEIHLNGLKTEFPAVSYVKAVDIWMFGCIFWIFSALAEFVVVKVIYSITEETRKENLVYSIKRKPDGDFAVEVDPLKEESNLVFRVFNTGPFNNARVSPITPYTKYWLWHELESVPNWPKEEVKGYKKKRLGSHVLSGRSITTSHLPLVNKTIWGMNIPLVWGIETSTSNQRAVLWRQIDNYSKWIFPVTFTIFCSVYWIVLVIHSYLL